MKGSGEESVSESDMSDHSSAAEQVEARATGKKPFTLLASVIDLEALGSNVAPFPTPCTLRHALTREVEMSLTPPYCPMLKAMKRGTTRKEKNTLGRKCLCYRPTRTKRKGS